MTPGTGFVKTLSAWRGLFVLAVVLVHGNVRDVDEFVHAGITFFFISSGFLLERHRGFSTLTVGGWSRFALLRALRLYPWHWLSTALVVGSYVFWGNSALHYDGWVLNLLLMQSWIPIRDVFFSLHGVSWFLSSIFFCWLCYPLLSWLCNQVRLRTMALWIVAGMVMVTWVTVTGDTARRDYCYVLPAFRLVDFALGMTLSRFDREWLSQRPLPSMAWRTVAEAVVVVLLVVLPMAVHRSSLLDRLGNATMWWVPDALLVLCCVWFNQHEGLVGRGIGRRWLTWVGKVSLEVYLLHYFAAITLNYTLMPLLGHFGWAIYEYNVVFSLPLTLLMAWAMHRCFSRPLWRWSSRVVEQLDKP